MNTYDEIKLNVVKLLNSSILNNSFTKLYRNDLEIAPALDYTPNIWENKWYNNAAIPGYSKGQCVWKYVYNDICSFMNDYGEMVYNYAHNNDLTRDYIDKEWKDVVALTSEPTKELWRQRYFNVISGYSKQTTTDMSMNDKVRYIKFVFEKDLWPSTTTGYMKIGKLLFTNGIERLAFPAKGQVFYRVDNIMSSSAVNIDDMLRDGMVDLQRKDSNKTTSFIVDLGKLMYQLKKYPLWKMYVSSIDSDKPSGFTVYASKDGEDYALIAKEVKPVLYIGDRYDGKIRVENVSKYVQLLDPMYEYGEYAGKQRTIEVYISTKDDNKDLLSNRTSWQNLVLSSKVEYNKFISTEISLLFDEHIRNYHLDGILSNAAEVDLILLARDLSNFNLENIPTLIKMTEHDLFMNADGFDYVVDFKCKRNLVDALEVGGSSKKYNIYQWYRLWNSGLLEHGGTIKCPVMPASEVPSRDFKDYCICVDLTWNGTNEIVYDYNLTSGYAYGDVFLKLYYGNAGGDSRYHVIESIDEKESLLKNSRYSISLTPIQFRYQEDLQKNKELFKDVSALVDYDYPSYPLSNKVSSYMTTEVHHVKNDSFCFTKSNTDKLYDNSIVLLYSYRTIGYVRGYVDVAFDPANGYEVQMKIIGRGSFIGSIPRITYDAKNYKLIGWFTERDGGTMVDETTKVFVNKIFYAHYQKIV